jgi:hypothetical protein
MKLTIPETAKAVIVEVIFCLNSALSLNDFILNPNASSNSSSGFVTS